jgi:hypothetical protein
MNRLLVLAGVVAVLLAAGCCCCGSGFDWDWDGFQPTVVFETPLPLARDTATPAETPLPGSTLTPSAVPTPIGDPDDDPVDDPASDDIGLETVALLAKTDIPVRDLHELAIRLRGLPPDTSRTINPGGSPDYTVGTRRLFHASNADTDEQFDVYATLEYKTEHVYMWVEEGEQADRDAVVEAADWFEEHIYLTNRAFFGSEWTPGVDNDPHVSILHAHNLGTSYYSSADEFISAVREDSNEMEMFYIDLDWWSINGYDYHGTLAHEFQHMIHWYHDRNEAIWMNEGFSELATLLNGFEPYTDYSFAQLPDNQLTDIDYNAADSGAGYGAGYLFTAYFLDRFGGQATQALVAHEENSLTSVDAVLTDLGVGITHEDLFADWIVANLLDDPSFADGRYGYRDIDPPDFRIEEAYRELDLPVTGRTTVHQYGTDYVELRGDQPLVLRFTGSTRVGLFDTTAHSGQYIWWANRCDDSDTRLTREFDLSEVSEATLEFWAWYHIEDDWDYAYVEASADGGQTWDILTTPSGVGTNPNGNSFGWGYTGKSGGGGAAQWVQEHVDLSAYAGQKVLVRFEYLTDDAVNYPGFVLDDIAIPEIGYSDDFEAGEGEWKAEGFIRHANVLPQHWLVQLVLFGRETSVQRLEVNTDQTGEWDIPLGGRTDRAVVTFSGLAPVTTETASYAYEIIKGR